MKKINMIAGLPRSGSTLLVNILNQHPDVYATSTSPLPFFVRNLVAQQHNSLEYKNLLDKFPKRTQQQTVDSIRAFTSTFCQAYGKDYVFDKSRGWTGFSEGVRDLYPDSKIIVCIRDIKDVFASVLKQDKRYGLIGGTSSIKQQFDNCFNTEGLIGAPYNSIVNMINGKVPDNIIFMKFENFIHAPAQSMQELYKICDIPAFEHDFNKEIENTAYDCDGHYLLKFPHQGSGIIRQEQSNYRDYVPQWAIDELNKMCINYNNFFGYK